MKKISASSCAALIALFLLLPGTSRADIPDSGYAVTVSGMVMRPLVFRASDFNSFGHSLHRDGEGRPFRGISLKRILDFCRIDDLDEFENIFITVKNEGGEGVVFTYVEIFGTDRADAVIALTGSSVVNGRPALIAPGRTLRGITAIEVRTSPPGKNDEPRLSIIGVGCGDVSLITQNAISAMARCDVFVCTDDIRERFAPYLAGKPVLFDPLMNLAHYYRKTHPGTSQEEAKRAVEKLRAENITAIKKAMTEGKRVGFLDYGDPTIYGSWTYWLLAHFNRGEYVVVPGVSAFNAANALIAKNVAVNGAVVITVPNGVRDNEPMVKAAAEKGDTLAIFVGLAEIRSVVPVLVRHFKEDTPVIVVYHAGYARQGRVVRTTLSGAIKAVEKEKEKFLGIIYIGEALR